ncbi:acetyltransferase [Virgibacillus sp. LDC-1]|uniref:acetyltransferase n=1 Tax=Virgibacillus sp. LDC-1 TaxID=3039856 RepID=UPI0024DE1BAD|nr:acetyltransferase [Virgibacillus sp. LDC-1]
MNKQMLLVGAGGHCTSVLDSLLSLKQFSKIGIVEKTGKHEKRLLGVPVVGCDADLPKLYEQGYEFAFVTVGSIGDADIRMRLMTLLEEIGFKIPTIIDPTAVVSHHVQLDKGIYVGKRAVVNAGVEIGKGAIINTGTIIEHDCRVGAFSHIAPGAVLNGAVHIGENTHIGANSTVKQEVTIGSNGIIGMGSTVLHNFGDHFVAYGNPCKEALK